MIRTAAQNRVHRTLIRSSAPAAQAAPPAAPRPQTRFWKWLEDLGSLLVILGIPAAAILLAGALTRQLLGDIIHLNHYELVQLLSGSL